MQKRERAKERKSSANQKRERARERKSHEPNADQRTKRQSASVPNADPPLRSKRRSKHSTETKQTPIHHCEANANLVPLQSRQAHLTTDLVSFSSTFDRFDLRSTHPHRRCTITKPQLRSTCTLDPMCIIYI